MKIPLRIHQIRRGKAADMTATQQFILSLLVIVAVLGIVFVAACFNRPDILLALKLLF